MGFEWRVLFREVTLSFFLVGVRTVLWVACTPFLFTSASLFLVLLLSSSRFCLLFVSRVFAFYTVVSVVARLCYFVPVIVVLLRTFSFPRDCCVWGARFCVEGLWLLWRVTFLLMA